MPIPVFLLPCQNVLLDALTNSVSAISILDSVQPTLIEIPDEAPPEVKAARYFLPPFFIIAVWVRSEGDAGEFEQHITLTAPDQRETRLTPDAPFEFAAPYHRVFQQSNPLFGRLSGIATLTLKIRRVGSDDWESALKVPLNIEEFPAPEDKKDESSSSNGVL